MSFIVPVKDCYLTSPFGWRNHPSTGKRHKHQGIDIGKSPNSNVEILAAADGEVIRTGALGTYGNVVMIKHTINGKRMDTNYAHLKDGSIKVKVGQKVKQGQVIGIMGKTGGTSTGIHLHFEIHNGAWLKDQPNAVDPLKYIKVYSKDELAKMKEAAEKAEEVARIKRMKEISISTLGTLKSNLKRDVMIKEIQAAEKDGRFSSKHTDVLKYDDETLQNYYLIALLRKK